MAHDVLLEGVVGQQGVGLCFLCFLPVFCILILVPSALVNLHENSLLC